MKEISDISPLKKIFIKGYSNNNNNNNNNKTCHSTNKREKKRKKKSKTKILSLPKKKYLEEGYDNTLTKNSEGEIDDLVYNKKTNSYDNKTINTHFNLNLNNSYNLNNNYFKAFINDDNIHNNNNKIKIKNGVKKKDYKNILVKNIVTSDKRLFIHINYIFCFSSKINKNNKYKYDNNFLFVKRNTFFSYIMENTCNEKKKNNLIKNNSIYENESINKSNTNTTKNNKDKYLFSCLRFIIKNINKVFLKKSFRYFLNNVDQMFTAKNK